MRSAMIGNIIHYDTGIVKQKLGISNDYIQDKEFFRYKTPIIIPPYSAKLGYFIFPTFYEEVVAKIKEATE